MTRPRSSLHQKKIGEILLQQDLVEADHITAALKEQVISGRRLGTILVQAGQLKLDDLSRCLSIQHGIPVATPKMLDRIDSETLGLLPAETCQRLKVMPLQVEDKILHLAMIDPVRSIAGEVSFTTSMAVRRHIVPELRMAFYQETYYDLARSPSLLRSAGPPSPDVPDRRRYLMNTVQAMMKDTTGDTAKGGKLKLKVGSPHPIEVAVDEAWDSLVEPTGDMGTDPEQAFQSRTPILTHRRSDLVIEMLAGAGSGRKVAEALVAPMFETVDLSVLFIVREGFAVGYMASEEGEDSIDRLVVSLANMSLLQMANQTRSVVRAKSESDQVNTHITNFFNRDPGPDTCVAPLVMEDHVVYLLWMQSKTDKSFPKSAQLDLARVMREAALTIGRLGRIHAVEDLSKEQLKATVLRLQENLETALRAKDAMILGAMPAPTMVDEAKDAPRRNRALVVIGLALAIAAALFFLLRIQQKVSTGMEEAVKQMEQIKNHSRQ